MSSWASIFTGVYGVPAHSDEWYPCRMYWGGQQGPQTAKIAKNIYEKIDAAAEINTMTADACPTSVVHADDY